jgi:arylsulfatase A
MKRFCNRHLIVVGLLFLLACKKDIQFSDAKADIAQSIVSASQPNIILVVAEDFGYEIPSCLGGQSYQTPNIDKMATRGMHFSQAYNHPDGFPSRLAIFTGKYNFRNYPRWGLLLPEESTIANMLQDDGYKTCIVGKWQMDNGGPSILEAGFEKYRIFLPFNSDYQKARRYKSPRLYENGDYIPDAQTEGLYSEDLFYDYASKFIDSNRNNPFFLVYSSLVCGQPFVPSPDHPDYAGWNPSVDDRLRNDTSYFASNVSYLDKNIGRFMAKLDSVNLTRKTLILFVNDNATMEKIVSRFRNQTVIGNKTETNRAGTQSPCFAYWPGTISHKISPALIDYTDILPTLADVAGIPVPNNYGTLDGISFYDDMLGIPGVDRDWVFCHWDNEPDDSKPVVRFINNETYKLYDEPPAYGRFYNIKKDVYELNNIPVEQMTNREIAIRNAFIQELQQLHN